MKRLLASSFLLLLLVIAAVPAAAEDSSQSMNLAVPGWHGNAIAYSGYRMGQHPDLHVYPTQDQVLQDLRILEKNWKIIRLYSSDQHAEDVLQVIRRGSIHLKVMLGVWLRTKPDMLNQNSLQIVRAVRLANAYPDIVAAVNVGNEILVSWSDHRLTEDQALAYLAQVKRAVRCPVTIADDSLYWRNPAAKLAEAVDFITMHNYPQWSGEDIGTALASTIRVYETVRSAHPGKTVVIGEAGWASYTDDPKNGPRAGSEEKEKRYYEELTAWAEANAVTVFVFEAFDEPWKGSGTEGHWGLFSEGRKAKQVTRERFPELASDLPTSPGYVDAEPAASAVVSHNKENR
jgi:exo-beta-1,3-glucanase (GH17 family)